MKRFVKTFEDYTSVNLPDYVKYIRNGEERLKGLSQEEAEKRLQHMYFYVEPKVENIDKIKQNWEKYGTIKVDGFIGDMILHDITKSGKKFLVNLVSVEEVEEMSFFTANKGIEVKETDNGYEFDEQLDSEAIVKVTKMIEDFKKG